MAIAILDQSPFRELVHVKRADSLCHCSYDVMCPNSAVNLHYEIGKVCEACGGIVSYYQNSEYNRIHGFSGWDEVHDH